ESHRSISIPQRSVTEYPLSGVNRTSRMRCEMSANEPKAGIETVCDQFRASSARGASGREPVLVQVDRQRVIATAAEHIAHPEDHAAQRRIDAVMIDRINNRAVQYADDPGLAANVAGRARVAERVCALDLHGIADPKTVHGLG